MITNYYLRISGNKKTYFQNQLLMVNMLVLRAND